MLSSEIGLICLPVAGAQVRIGSWLRLVRGVALCAVACGVFLVRRVIRLMKAEDKFEEELLNADQTAISPSEPNSARQETNRTTPPPEAGQNIK